MPLTVNPSVLDEGVRNIQAADLVSTAVGCVSVNAEGLSTPGVQFANNGADFGPDTPGTTTMGLKEGITAGAGLKTIITGAFLVNTQISPLPSNTWLEFDNATITVGSGLATNVFAATGKSNLYFTGVVSFIGTGGGTANVFLLSACSRVHFNWDASVVGLSQSPVKYLINAGQSGGTQSTQMKLEGRTLTDGSVVFIGKDVSLVEICGVQSQRGGFTSVNGDAVVRFTSDNAAGAMHGINVHDIDLDFGGQLATQAGVAVVSASTANEMFDVTVRDVHVRNNTSAPTVETQDAVDINCCTYVTVSDIVSENVGGCPFAINASYATVTNVTGTNCAAPMQVGDPNFQHENFSNVTVSNCTITNCGQAFSSSFSGAGIMVVQTAAFTISNVAIVNCISMDTTGSAQKFGLSVCWPIGGTGTAISNVSVIGGQYSGFTSALNTSVRPVVQGSITLIQGAVGINPIGLLATPFSGTSVGLILGSSGAAAPTASTTYTVVTTPVYITSTGGTSVSITITDGKTNTIISGATTLTVQRLEPGWTINFGAFSPGPTVLAYGA